MSSSGSHRRILIVEDDQSTREMLTYLLRQRDLAVDVAPGGREALDLLTENSYSVVLLDLLMPQPDGFAVLDSVGSAVVLVVTGADRSITDQLDSQRIHGIVRKPFDHEELASLVVACSEIRSRGSFGMMAMAVISSARFLDWIS